MRYEDRTVAGPQSTKGIVGGEAGGHSGFGPEDRQPLRRRRHDVAADGVVRLRVGIEL